MKNKNIKILFIGNIQRNELPTGGGVQAKNQQIVNYLLHKRDIIFSMVDTWNKSSIKSLVDSIKAILKSSADTRVYFSITTRGVVAIVSILKLLRIKRDLYLFVPGGSVDKNLSMWERRCLRTLKYIYVQGRYIKDFYKANGLYNVKILHNFKDISYRPPHDKKYDGSLKCVFLGRLFPEKGIDTIIEAFSNLLDDNISIDLYGSLNEYSIEDFTYLRNVAYKGFLNLSESSGYDVLARYDVMVFPTRFEGEGFPGVILDAFIAGLPIVTTDFHVNPEIVIENLNGFIIPVSDSQSLAMILKRIANDPILLQRLKKGAFDSASHYTPETLLKSVFE